MSEGIIILREVHIIDKENVRPNRAASSCKKRATV